MIIQARNALLHNNIWEEYNMYVGKNGVYGGNVEIIKWNNSTISKIYKLSASVYFASRAKSLNQLLLETRLQMKEIIFVVQSWTRQWPL